MKRGTDGRSVHEQAPDPAKELNPKPEHQTPICNPKTLYTKARTFEPPNPKTLNSKASQPRKPKPPNPEILNP